MAAAVATAAFGLLSSSGRVSQAVMEGVRGSMLNGFEVRLFDLSSVLGMIQRFDSSMVQLMNPKTDHAIAIVLLYLCALDGNHY